MRISELTRSSAAAGLSQPEGAVARHELTSRLLLNARTGQFFNHKDARESTRKIIDIFDGMMRNEPLMKILSPKINEIDRLSREEIIDRANGIIAEYLQETGFAVPTNLTATDLLVNNFLATTPNGEIDLGQFLSQNLAALQMISNPSQFEKYKTAIIPRFEKVYLVLRAGEIISGGKVVPITAPPLRPQPIEATAKLERQSIDAINKYISIPHLDKEWRELISLLILAPHPIMVTKALTEAIDKFQALSPEEISAEASRYDHSIHQPGQADLPHPHDAKELGERGLGWAKAILTASHNDSGNVSFDDLTAAFRTALVWLSSQYHPDKFLKPREDYAPKKTPDWMKKYS